MEPIVSMLQSTRQHAVQQKSAFVGRTREAGLAFAAETRDAGRDVVRFVRHEARRWGRYVRVRAGKVALGGRDLLAPRAVERELLARVDGTLRALDGRVVGRLQELQPKDAGARAKRAGPPTRAVAAPKRRKSALAARASGTALVAGGRKHAS